MNFSIFLLAIFALCALTHCVPLVPDVRHIEVEDDLPVVRQARQFGNANAVAMANANSMGGGYGGYPYGGYGGYPYGGYGGGSANAMALANANSMG